MSAFPLYGSVIHHPRSSSSSSSSPLLPVIQERCYLPSSIPIRPFFPFRNNRSNRFPSTTSVLQRDHLGLISSSDSNDTVSSQTATTTHTEEEEAAAAAAPLGSVVADTKSEEKVSKLRKRKEEEEEEEDSFDNRFKLRNGREVFEEKGYLVGVERKGDGEDLFGIEESLRELEQLADTAGLKVVGSTYQKLTSPNPRTYIGSGKVSEIKSAIQALDVETVIFDDELSAGQFRNLEKVFGRDVRVCDRTALILDVFNQRTATHEASLQAVT